MDKTVKVNNSKIQNKTSLPEGWKQVKLGEIADIIMGQSPSSTLVNEQEIGIPFLQGNAEFTNKYPIAQRWISKGLKFAKEGDILISVRAPVGAVNIADRAYCIGRGLAAISFKKIEIRFGWFGLIYWKYQLENLSQGSTFEAISKEDLKNVILITPFSVSEQRKIAEILETIDNAIEKTDRVIEKYKRIKQGFMQELLTKGIDENGQIRSEETHRFKNSSLGRIPEEWEVVELGEVAFNITDGKHGDCKDEENSGYYFISAKDIYDGKINYENAREITKKDFEEAHRRTKLEPYDIVLTNSGTIGKIAIVNDQPETYKTTFQKSVAIIKLNLYLANPYFVTQELESVMRKLINESYGSAQQNLLLRDLRRLLIPLPPLPEQRRIAEILFQVDEVIEKEQKYKEKLERIKQGLMEDLLTGKVRVIHLIEEGQDENQKSNFEEFSSVQREN